MIFDVLRVFSSSAVISEQLDLGTGSDFTLLRMASRRLEEISKRAIVLNLFLFFFTRAVCRPSTHGPKTTNHPLRSILYTPHTPGVCVTRLFISQLNDFFLVLPFHVRELLLRVSAHFFFFHADSLTRLFIVEKRKDPCFFQNGGRKGDETQQVIQNAFIHRFDGHSEASPSCLPVRQPDCLFRLPTSHLTATKTNQIVTNDDLRPGLDYFSFVT